MSTNTKLELTWIGKNESQQPIEPRILVEDSSYSYGNVESGLLTNGKQWSGNMLIHGDNLLALKALEKDYYGCVKCIYIDPPYNINAANEYYDDNVEHSKWLSLMKPRLEILFNLLRDDGVIFIQINDDEQAYLKVLCDEVFGRNNFINMICVKAKASSGASGGGEDRKLKKNIEYILAYSRSNAFDSFKTQYKIQLLSEYIKERESAGKNFAYKSVMVNPGTEVHVGDTVDGSGETIQLIRLDGYQIKSVSQLMKEEHLTSEQVYSKYIDKIFTLENAQTSIRDRVLEAVGEGDDYYIARYVPKTGRNKGKVTDVGFMGKTKRLVSYLGVLCEKIGGKIYKLDKVGTLWDDMSWSSVKMEGGMDFPNSKKPEVLIRRIIEMSTDPGDIVLDSFLGSGTTSAVAHKMGRKYIGVEMGNHAYSHCVERLKLVVDGKDNSGITKAVGWKGGGGFKFYELAPSLLKKDSHGNLVINKEYNADMLAAAMAKLQGFVYQPSTDVFWKQGHSSESDFIFTTTQFMTVEALAAIEETMNDGESLLVCCKSFQSECKSFSSRITVKKIPAVLLDKCEFDHDDYSLNVVELPEIEEKSEDSSDAEESEYKTTLF